MSLAKILDERYSVRAFTEKPVPETIIQSVFQKAQRSSSNCNVQPWQTLVVSGDSLKQLKKDLVETVVSQRIPNPDFNWLPAYQNEHRERQFGSANALYSALSIERSDSSARQQAMLRNWQCFDAPHAVFFTMEKYLDIMGAVDIGIYAQTLSLLLWEQGVSSCMQGALGQFPDPIKERCKIPESRGVLFGMSFGYPDLAAPANQVRTMRAPLESSVQFFS